MIAQHSSSGLGKSLLFAAVIILMATTLVLVFSTRNESQDVRSRAAYPGVVSKTPTYAPTPKKLQPGEKCKNNCYDGCESGVGWDKTCKSREAYCKALKNPVARNVLNLQPIECP